jgi:hypothetical protein
MRDREALTVEPVCRLLLAVMTRAIRRAHAIVVLALVASACASSQSQLESAPAPPDATAVEVLRAAPQAVDGRLRGGLLAGPGEDGDDAEDSIVAHGAAPEIVAYAEPDGDAEIVERFDNPTPRGGPLVFRAVDEPVDGWLEVLLPIRPNGSTGWIRVTDVALSRNPYWIELAVEDFRLTIYRRDAPVLSTTVAIGNGETPTPIGDFYLIELLQPPDPTGIYGPYAYGLSGFSDTLDSFNGGPGIIGIHGTNEPELLGSNVSHGCVRVDNEVISLMASFMPLGTPIEIRR